MAIGAFAPETRHIPNSPAFSQNSDRSFDVLCNNPARALTYLIAAHDPETPYTPAAFADQLYTMQNTEIGWNLGSQAESVTRDYCNNILVPTRLFEKTIVKGIADSPVVAYQAARRNLDHRIGMAASVLDWELQFPHLKLTTLLGETRLDAEKTTPPKRLRIYQTLLDSSAQPPSTPRVLNGTLRRLLSCGILTKLSDPELQAPSSPQIREDLRPAIEDLVLRIHNLQTNPAFVEAAIKRAKEILSDPAAVSLLLRKAKPNSDMEVLPAWWAKDPRAVLRARLGSLTLQRLPIEPRWEERALCRAIVDRAEKLEDKIAAAELFFPPGTEGPSQEQAELAKKVCRKCPARVAASCLQWALDTGQQKGVYGGLTPDGRRKYRNRKPRVDALQVNPTRPRTNSEISELLEDRATQKQTTPSRPAKDLQKQG